MRTGIKTGGQLLVLVLAVTVLCGWVQAAPQRIVSLAPSITENLFALGVGEQVVGVTSFCDYPLEALQRTVIGDAFNLNLEILLSLEPDLVVGDATVVQGYLEELEALGVPVLAVAPTSLAEIQASLISLGEAVGQPRRGRELAEAMESRLQKLQAGIKSATKPRVFVEVWNEPLMTAGPGSFLDELIVLAGGENIAGDSDNPWPLFSEEVVIQRDPQILILTGFNKEEVLARPAWQGLEALRRGLVYEVDPDLYARSTPRLLDALQELIEIFHEAEE